MCAQEGKTRHDFGREGFVERVHEWKEAYGDRITMQLRRLGCSLDWSREVFTMDAARAAAVNEAFVSFHEKGLLYRGVRLTNWCSQLKSAISDIEVEHLELDKRSRITVPGYDKTIPFGARARARARHLLARVEAHGRARERVGRGRWRGLRIAWRAKSRTRHRRRRSFASVDHTPSHSPSLCAARAAARLPAALGPLLLALFTSQA